MAYYIDKNKCTACSNCVQVCMNGAIIDLMHGELYINSAWCHECGSCAAMCYDMAIQYEGIDEGSILESREHVRELSWYEQEDIAV